MSAYDADIGLDGHPVWVTINLTQYACMGGAMTETRVERRLAAILAADADAP